VLDAERAFEQGDAVRMKLHLQLELGAARQLCTGRRRRYELERARAAGRCVERDLAELDHFRAEILEQHRSWR
jgi:hypothetical protein